MAGLGRVDGVQAQPAMNESLDQKPRTDRAQVPLIFEESVPGRKGADLAPRPFASRPAVDLIGADLCRAGLAGLPEVSEPQVMRHFLRLSQLNFAQALQFYPLGSCTMKYNPPTNDESAGLPGFAGLHPLTPAHLAQGALELMVGLESALAEISAMDAVSLASRGRRAGRVGRSAR